MLVVTRKLGEEIVIDGNIRVSIQRISSTRVRVGIDAPNDVAIARGELVFECVAEDFSEVDSRSDDAISGDSGSTDPVSVNRDKSGPSSFDTEQIFLSSV